MIRCRPGLVTVARQVRPGLQHLQVLVDGDERAALNYVPLAGRVESGQRVMLNTTATSLGLGTGGWDFVMYCLEATSLAPETGTGHIMKLRYTPWQLQCLAVEEPASPHHEAMRQAESLAGMPVVAVELHSQLAVTVAAARLHEPPPRIAFVMTDAGALPASFSRTLHRLREAGWLEATITTGHAFGGDFEAVNVHSGLLAAHAVVDANIVVSGMGPGIVGTGTPFGFSGTSVAEVLHAADRLDGRPVAVPRISFADPRPRHQGLSHHTETLLTRLLVHRVWVPVPYLAASRRAALRQALHRCGRRHRVIWLETGCALTHIIDALREIGIRPETMGRTVQEDPSFFAAAAAAGLLAGTLWRRGPVADDGTDGKERFNASGLGRSTR